MTAARMLATASADPRGRYLARGTPCASPNMAMASTQHSIRRWATAKAVA